MSRHIRKLLFVSIIICMVFALSQAAMANTGAGAFITTEGVNLRNAPTTTGDIITTIGPGSSLTMLNHDPAGWSRVRINGTEGYVRSDFLTFPAGSAPLTFKTTADAVRIRSAPNTSSDILRTINIGSSVEVLTHDPAGWASIRINGTEGFIRSDLLMLPITETVAAPQTAGGSVSAQAVQTLQTIGGVNLRQSPSTGSNIITVLNSGTRVEVLGNGNDGWSEVRVNGNTGFIRSDLLGTSSSRNVELLTMSQVRPLLRYNVDIPITDVRTGRTYNIRIGSMGLHADVEPSTQRDTDIKFETRGGRWSWAARPVLVHVGGRTIAASINGMPHAGDFIAGNGMYGHVCLHFHDTVVNNQRYQNDLRSAVLEAYNSGR